MARTAKHVSPNRKSRPNATAPSGRRSPSPSSSRHCRPALDHRNPRERYLDECAPSGVVGRLVKFSKDGKFTFADDGEAIAESDDFVVLADQTLVSWVKFNGEGEPPTRIGGLLYSKGFVLPPHESSATSILAIGRSACRASRKTRGSTNR